MFLERKKENMLKNWGLKSVFPFLATGNQPAPADLSRHLQLASTEGIGPPLLCQQTVFFLFKHVSNLMTKLAVRSLALGTGPDASAPEGQSLTSGQPLALTSHINLETSWLPEVSSCIYSAALASVVTWVCSHVAPPCFGFEIKGVYLSIVLFLTIWETPCCLPNNCSLNAG